MSRGTYCSGRQMPISPIAAMLVLMFFATSAGAQFQQQDQAQGRRMFSLNLHDNAAEVVLTSPAGENLSTAGPVTKSYGFFFNADGGMAASASMHASGGPTQGFNPLEVGVGAKVYGIYADEAGRAVSALAISGSMKFVFAGQMPQAFIVKANIAPNITSFGSAERVFEGNMRYQMDVTPHASVYLGYRYLHVQMDGGDSTSNTLDSGLHLGVQVGF